MNFKSYFLRSTRSEEQSKGLTSEQINALNYEMLVHEGLSVLPTGWSNLSNRPEVIAGVDKIANLVASLTIKIMENQVDDKGNKLGDKNVNNGLAAKLDQAPNSFMTRNAFIKNLIYTLYLNGDGNAICIVDLHKGNLTKYIDDIKNGRENYIENIVPVEPSKVFFYRTDEYYEKKGITSPYYITINGKVIDPRNVLHFRIGADPEFIYKGTGPRVPLSTVSGKLARIDALEKEYLTNAYFPSFILKWNAYSGGTESERKEFASKLDKIFKGWNKDRKPGDILNVPNMDANIEQVKPMSLNDLAIKDSKELSNKTVASLLGVPLFIIDGSNKYDNDEYNQFIKSTIVPLSQMISQELTNKLVINHNQYIKLDCAKLYKYDAAEIAMYKNLVTTGAITRNELRDKIGMEPSDNEGMNDFIALENYIPVDKLGDQKKLYQDEGGDKSNE